MRWQLPRRPRRQSFRVLAGSESKANVKVGFLQWHGAKLVGVERSLELDPCEGDAEYRAPRLHVEGLTETGAGRPQKQGQSLAAKSLTGSPLDCRRHPSRNSASPRPVGWSSCSSARRSGRESAKAGPQGWLRYWTSSPGKSRARFGAGPGSQGGMQSDTVRGRLCGPPRTKGGRELPTNRPCLISAPSARAWASI